MNLSMGQTAMTIENMEMMKEQYKVMKEVSDAQSQMFKQVDMDDVQEMMMDGMVGDTEIDEDELDRELASISVEPMPTPGMSVPGQQVGPTADPIAPVPSMPAQDNAFNLNDLNTL